ncbi:type IV secretion system protein, partial [Xanthomonas graminis]
LFILCLLFDATKSLFQKWLLYGIGTMFSLSVLTFTVSLATKVTTAVAAGFIAKWAATNGTAGEGVMSMALQQGGIGLVLSTLILTAPPMAAAFFQGTLGQFNAYSQLGQVGKDPATGQPYTPQAPASNNHRNATEVNSSQVNTRVAESSLQNVASTNVGSRGLAQ